MTDVFYADQNSDAAKFQAKQRWHRGHTLQPVIIIDLLKPESFDDFMRRRLEEKRANLFEQLKPFIQMTGAQITK